MMVEKMGNVIEKASLILHQQLSLNPCLPVLVGVSGGADSIALANVLHELGYPVIVAHFNHGLRAAACTDEAFVEKFATNCGFAFISGGADVSASSNEMKISLEDAGRRLRYRYLFSQAKECGAQAVAVGHTANDQAETVLLRLLRGTGLSGMCGMHVSSVPNSWSDEIPIIRPLLTTWRTEIVLYLASKNLEYRTDESNLNLRFTRNHIRHQIIPELEKINPNLQASFVRMAQTFQGDMEIVQQVVDQVWGDAYKNFDGKTVGIDRKIFLCQKVGVQRRLILMSIKLLISDDQEIGYDVIERVVQAISRSAQIETMPLAAGLYLNCDDDTIWFGDYIPGSLKKNWPQIRQEEPTLMQLSIPGSLELEGGWLLKAELLERKAENWPEDIDVQDPMHAWLAVSLAGQELHIRPRLPGDRFHPYGLSGHRQKLSDFMINSKIPRGARERWPIVMLDGKIAWVAGWRVASGFEITSTTQQILHLYLEKPADESSGY